MAFYPPPPGNGPMSWGRRRCFCFCFRFRFRLCFCFFLFLFLFLFLDGFWPPPSPPPSPQCPPVDEWPHLRRSTNAGSKLRCGVSAPFFWVAGTGGCLTAEKGGVRLEVTEDGNTHISKRDFEMRIEIKTFIIWQTPEIYPV